MSQDYSVDAVAVVEFLNGEDPFHQWSLGQEIWCLHCNSSFKAERVGIEFVHGKPWKVFCPNNCDGLPHDWSEYPWFR